MALLVFALLENTGTETEELLRELGELLEITGTLLATTACEELIISEDEDSDPWDELNGTSSSAWLLAITARLL